MDTEKLVAAIYKQLATMRGLNVGHRGNVVNVASATPLVQGVIQQRLQVALVGNGLVTTEEFESRLRFVEHSDSEMSIEVGE